MLKMKHSFILCQSASPPKRSKKTVILTSENAVITEEGGTSLGTLPTVQLSTVQEEEEEEEEGEEIEVEKEKEQEKEKKAIIVHRLVAPTLELLMDRRGDECKRNYVQIGKVDQAVIATRGKHVVLFFGKQHERNTYFQSALPRDHYRFAFAEGILQLVDLGICTQNCDVFLPSLYAYNVMKRYLFQWRWNEWHKSNNEVVEEHTLLDMVWRHRPPFWNYRYLSAACRPNLVENAYTFLKEEIQKKTTRSDYTL